MSPEMLSEEEFELAEQERRERLRNIRIADLEQRLLEECRNKKQFERDWLQACDQLSAVKRQLAEAQEHVRHLMMFAECRMDDEDKYSLIDPDCEKCQAAKKWRDAAIDRAQGKD